MNLTSDDILIQYSDVLITIWSWLFMVKTESMYDLNENKKKHGYYKESPKYSIEK